MITLDDFQAMNKNEKSEAVKSGDYLAERKEDQLIIRLYKVGNFYVETFCKSTRIDILHFIAFKSNDLLIPYIKKDFRF